MSDVTIIGLGQMGTKLAELMLEAGKQVSVWNRTAAKADALVARGARLEASPAAAIGASAMTIICVYDYDAVRAILSSAGVERAIAGRLIVSLGTGSPEDAVEAGLLVTRHGGRFLDGAIQAAPNQMGEATTLILLSGPQSAVDEARPLLHILAGNLMHLGEEVESAAFMDLATLSYVYGAVGGFIHGARIAEAVGISVKSFGAIVNDISPSFGAFFQHEGAVIDSGNFSVTESPMRISITAVARILRTSEALEINTEMPCLLNRWLERAEAAGLADEELAALIKVLRVAPVIAEVPSSLGAAQ